jgi:Uncharacterized conserved protein
MLTQNLYFLIVEKRQDIIKAIKIYFQKEREEEFGDLAASLLLDFFMDKLAIEFYNQGIYDYRAGRFWQKEMRPFCSW